LQLSVGGAASEPLSKNKLKIIRKKMIVKTGFVLRIALEPLELTM